MSKKQAWRGLGYVRVPKAILYSSILTPLERLLWMDLAEQADKADKFGYTVDGYTRYERNATAARLGISKDTVAKCYHQLIAHGGIYPQTIHGLPYYKMGEISVYLSVAEAEEAQKNAK